MSNIFYGMNNTLRNKDLNGTYKGLQLGKVGKSFQGKGFADNKNIILISENGIIQILK